MRPVRRKLSDSDPQWTGRAIPKVWLFAALLSRSLPNNLLERQDWLEKRLLSELQEEVLKPEAIEYVLAEFGRQLKGALENLSGELSEMRERKAKIEAELRRLRPPQRKLALLLFWLKLSTTVNDSCAT